MESETNHNCNFCEKPNALKKCGKSHTRCKPIRFCNKNCETSAHSKERESKVTANENPGDNSGKSLKQLQIESEIKKEAKNDRRMRRNINRAINAPERAILTPNQMSALRGITSTTNTPRARNGQRQEGIRVPPTPEDGTQDQN